MMGIRRRITVEGLNLERFVQRSGAKGIAFRALHREGRKLILDVDEHALPELMTFAQEGGWRIVVGGRSGVGKAFNALLRRKWAILSLATVVLAVMATSQLMWGVDITGSDLYAADVAAYLEYLSIRPVMLKREVDQEKLRDELEWRYPDVAWVECGWRGPFLHISLAEGTPQGETLTHIGSGDVVAARGGVVERIITVAGTPAVKAGDVVQAGQVLIRGEERTADEGIVPVMARGLVYARVWDSAAARIPAISIESSYTGRTQETWNISCPWFSLWQAGDSGFEQQDTSRNAMPLGGVFFPFKIIWENHLEVEHIKKKRHLEEIKTEGEAAAIRLLREKIGIHDELVDKWVDYCMIDDEVLEAVATGERVIDIARQRRTAR